MSPAVCQVVTKSEPRRRHRSVEHLLRTRRIWGLATFSPFQVVAYVPLTGRRNTRPDSGQHIRRRWRQAGARGTGDTPVTIYHVCRWPFVALRSGRWAPDIKTIFSHCVYNAQQCHTSPHISTSGRLVYAALLRQLYSPLLAGRSQIFSSSCNNFLKVVK